MNHFLQSVTLALVLGEESGRIVKTDRAGKLLGRLSVGTAGQFDGLTMAEQGRL